MTSNNLVELVDIFKKAVIDSSTNWVLFKNGTCVLLLNSQEDIQSQAIKILKEHGSVIPGTPSGDFEVTKIPEIDGWLITGDYPGILNYVSSQDGQKKGDFEIGMIGRERRELDAKELGIIHVEDKQTVV